MAMHMDHQSQLYRCLEPVAIQVLQVFLENTSGECIKSFMEYTVSCHLPDGSHLSQWVDSEPGDLFKSQVVLALANWISSKSQQLDMHVITMARSHLGGDCHLNNHCPLEGQLGPAVQRMNQCSARIQNYMHQKPADSLCEIIYHFTIQLLGPESACLASALAGLSDRTMETTCLLSHMVSQLELIRAKVAKVALELWSHETFVPEVKMNHATLFQMQFCRCFTVTDHYSSPALEPHEVDEASFQDSQFGIILIDSYGSLMKLLLHMEELTHNEEARRRLVMAVDFEGVELHREGKLCLVQMTLSDRPNLVYVLDVFVLHNALLMQTPRGTSMKDMLENDQVLKVWFDPRNDVDALFHQFGIQPSNIFDLQLAEVAGRRSKGLTVKYVQSLQKCLSACDRLEQHQKSFAERINLSGK
ncbi:unnamed protein product, partial [Effrenium voratum]